MPIPCSLWLDVYEDDRTTIAWTVTTEPGASNPYLIDPMRYGSQEIDVAKGAATIGTVTVGVIDPATIAGDQDSGWMTARLANVFGRRCRLRRFISDAVQYVVIADGPAGEPRLEPDYASYTWEIRDTRETERKVRAFEDASPTTSIWPAGPVSAFGDIPAVTPNVGDLRNFFPPARRIDFGSYWATGLGTPAADGSTVVDPEVVVTPAIEALLLPTVTPRTDGLIQYTYENLIIRWRQTALGGAYTEVEAPYFLWNAAITPEPFFLVRDGTLATGQSVRAVWRSALLTAVLDEWSAALWALPAGTDIDVLVLVRGPASKTAPVHVIGLTAGEFSQNAYDGLYSPRDADGNIVPTGTRYDETALLAMDTPVSLRLFEPIKDARDWLEKYIYTPTGWAPALDDEGLISPVSQEWPTSAAGLEDIDDDITEPRPSWAIGRRTINVLRFIYWRDYIPDPSIRVEKTGDGLAEQRVEIEFRDKASIARHGEQVLEIDGRAFRATTPSGFGEPDNEDITAETGYQLAQLRNTLAKGRYQGGAPSFSVSITRAGAPTVRVGSYVDVDLSWFPDPFVTGRRGLAGIGQVMALAQLDCAWREVVIEMVPPPPPAIDDLDATTFSHTRIDLAWTLPERSTGVKLYRSTSSGFTPGGGNLIATLGAVEEYEDTTGLSASTAYFYKAIAFNASGDATASNEATDTTDATPTPPNLLTATRTETEDGDGCVAHTWQHEVAWTTSGADDTNYEIWIYQATDAAGTEWQLLQTGLTTVSDSVIHDTGLAGNINGSSDEETLFQKYRVSLMPVGGGPEVEHLDTDQGQLNVYSDGCP